MIQQRAGRNKARTRLIDISIAMSDMKAKQTAGGRDIN